MPDSNPLVDLSSLIEHGIVTDKDRLLKSRHWAGGLKLFSKRAAQNMLLGNVRSRFRGRGMEFEEVRRYQAGDDIRTIDWRVSARMGDTYTKLFREDRERPCHILVDQRSSLFFGSVKRFKSVLAAELAVGLGWAALAGGDRVGSQVLGEQRESDNRARQNKQAVLNLVHDLHALNHELAELAQSSNEPHSKKRPTPLSHALEECQRLTRPGTAIFIISDFHDINSAATKALINLGKHADLTLLQVTDSLEQNLPLTGNLAISDGDQSSRISINSGLKMRYLQKLAERDAQLKSAAANARAMYTQIDTSETARSALIRIFAR